MTREYNFEDHFWENQEINGYVILMNRMKQAKQTCEKLKAVYESSCNETGQLGVALNTIDTQWESTAKAHLQMATKLKNHIILPLVDLLDKQKQIRKELETNIKKLYNNRQLQSHCVLRALDRYNTECTKANELMQHGSRDAKQIAYKRSKIIIKQCLIAYEDALADFDDITKQWNEQWQYTCKEFELLEVERLEFLKINMQEFNQAFVDMSGATIAAHTSINEELELINVDEDLDFFVKEFGGSSIMPNAKDYFKFYMAHDKFKENNHQEHHQDMSSTKNHNGTDFTATAENDDMQQQQEHHRITVDKEQSMEEEDDIVSVDGDDTIYDQELKNDNSNKNVAGDYENQFMVGRLEIYNSEDDTSDFDDSENCYSEYHYENENIGTIDKEPSNNNSNNSDNEEEEKEEIKQNNKYNNVNHPRNNQSVITNDPLNKEYMDDYQDKQMDSHDNDMHIENAQQPIDYHNKDNNICFEMMDENRTIPIELLENNNNDNQSYHHYENLSKEEEQNESNDQYMEDNQLFDIINGLKTELQQKNETISTKRTPKKLPKIKTQDSVKMKSRSSSPSQKQQYYTKDSSMPPSPTQNQINSSQYIVSSSPPPVPRHQPQSPTTSLTEVVNTFYTKEENGEEDECMISPTSSLSSNTVHEELEDMLRQLEKQSKKPSYHNNNKKTAAAKASTSSSDKIRLSGVRQRYPKGNNGRKLLEELSETNEFENDHQFEKKIKSSPSSQLQQTNTNNNIYQWQTSSLDNATTITSSPNYHASHFDPSSTISSLAKNSLSIAKPIDKSQKWTLEEATKAMSQALSTKRRPLPKQPIDTHI
ncbi:hypothetical protein BJ944DRAFT_229862 [Cunninghamella echinulata]|nr:hypothetical protein BJ944DRAFT_229862 [Cunninghamella echinulata]